MTEYGDVIVKYGNSVAVWHYDDDTVTKYGYEV